MLEFVCYTNFVIIIRIIIITAVAAGVTSNRATVTVFVTV